MENKRSMGNVDQFTSGVLYNSDIWDNQWWDFGLWWRERR